MIPEDVQAALDAQTAAIAALTAELADLKTKVPTLEELPFQQSLQRFDGKDQITGNWAWTFFVAPIKCKVLSVALLPEYQSIGGSDSNYWRFTLQKGAGTSWVDVAQRSTQNTGPIAGGSIQQRKPWTFDAAAWGDATLQAGQAMRIAFAPFGNIATTAPVEFPLALAGRYAPVA